METAFSINLIICTYNNAALLKRTLGGIAQLEVPAHISWSVLVVNNNCTDETESVVGDQISKKDIPIRMIRETQQGLTSARLCGVQNTDAAWIAFIDDDCVLATNWIEEAEKFIIAHPNCGLFGGKIQLLWEEEPPSYVMQFPFAYAAKNHGDTAKPLAAIAGAGMIIQREALERSGWVKEQFLADRVGKKLISGGDMEIALRVGVHSEVWYNPDCTLQHIIPQRRTTKEYLQRIVFGLGASRHNVAALNWKGSYFSWFLYTCAYSIGMLGTCLVNCMGGISRRAGLKVVFSPYFGWNAAMVSMFSMEVEKRKKLLGCIQRG
jgi:glycosyltransferase involved in cell wall biosynthesis